MFAVKLMKVDQGDEAVKISKKNQCNITIIDDKA